MKAVLILKDGTTLYGSGFGARTTKVGELVFNTSMIGYQEALTDPSYAGQILLLTYPLIGNYGINAADYESGKVQVEGFAVREACSSPQHPESRSDLGEFLEDAGVPGAAGIDTRFVVRRIREHGVTPALLATYPENIDVKKLLESIRFDYSAENFVEKVTTREPKVYGNTNGNTNRNANGNTNGARAKKIVLIDYGVKMGIVRELVNRGAQVTVLPSFASFEDVLSHGPDGVLLSNGPGDPAILTDAHALIRRLVDKGLPVFGICLGHQLLAHAFGGKTFKLKFGHRGSNHPVLDKLANRVSITTQNHGFAVDAASVDGALDITHVNLNDATVEGMAHREKPVFSVQYHPEACPGPHDSRHLFDKFLKML